MGPKFALKLKKQKKQRANWYDYLILYIQYQCLIGTGLYINAAIYRKWKQDIISPLLPNTDVFI